MKIDSRLSFTEMNRHLGILHLNHINKFNFQLHRRALSPSSAYLPPSLSISPPLSLSPFRSIFFCSPYIEFYLQTRE